MHQPLFGDDDFRVPSCSGCTKHGMCVAVAIKPEGVAVRDTKDPTKTTLVFNREEWSAFLAGVQAGEFNL